MISRQTSSSQSRILCWPCDQQTLEREVNDPELLQLIRSHLNIVAERFEDLADRSDVRMQLVDRAGLGLAASAVVVATGALIATSGAMAPLVFLACALSGVAVTGFGRSWFHMRVVQGRSAAKKIRRLAIGFKIV